MSGLLKINGDEDIGACIQTEDKNGKIIGTIDTEEKRAQGNGISRHLSQHSLKRDVRHERYIELPQTIRGLRVYTTAARAGRSQRAIIRSLLTRWRVQCSVMAHRLHRNAYVSGVLCRKRATRRTSLSDGCSRTLFGMRQTPW